MMLVLFLFTVSIPAATSHLGLVRCTRLDEPGIFVIHPHFPGDRGAFPLCLPSLLCDAPLESPDPVPSLTAPNLAGSGLAVISDLGER
jgi:hypothetical protein